MWAIAVLTLSLGVAAKLVCGGLDEYLLATGMWPAWSVWPVARLIVAAECLVCALLIWPRTRRWGWAALGGLGASFGTVHVAAIFLGDVRPCRCFGVELSQMALWSHIAMAALCAVLFLMAWHGSKSCAASRPMEKEVTPCAS